jgi:hypothetical protein
MISVMLARKLKGCAQYLEDGYTTFIDPSYQGSTLVFSTEMSTNDILPCEKNVIFVSRKTYEFTDHLGNVSATISDRKITIAGAAGNAVASYAPEVLSEQDYFPFGMGMMGRSVTAEGYRYGYQNQEEDEELWGGAVSYKYRIEDARLGRFFSVDPLAPKYPHNSVYAFSENRIMDAIELEGLECYFIHGTKTMRGLKTYPGVNGKMMSEKSLTRFSNLFGNTKIDQEFNWDGNLTRRSRKNAAKALAKHIEATMLGGDEPITLIGHSHGGNVAIDAVNILVSKGLVTSDKINIVALNTPALTVETNLEYEDVDLYAVNADWDKIQHGGTDNPGKPTVKGADGVIEYEDQEEGSFFNHNGWLDCNVDEYFMLLKITVANFLKSKSKKIQSKESSESDLRKVDIELKTDKIQAPNGKK